MKIVRSIVGLLIFQLLGSSDLLFGHEVIVHERINEQKKEIMKLQKLMMAVFAIAQTTRMSAADLELPAAARTNLHGALQAISRFAALQELNSGFPEKWKERFRQGHVFDQAMERLGATLDGQIGANAASEASIEAKLTVLALDRKQRPEVYKEIDEAYVSAEEHVRRRQADRAIVAPVLNPQYAIEKYRLPWEYFLLRPRIQECIPLYESRAVEALARIRSEKSLITLLEHFRVYSNPTVTDRGKQSGALNAIAAFQSAKGFETLLQCMRIDESVPVSAEPSNTRINVEQWVEDRLTSRVEPEYHEKWKAVLQDYPVQAPSLSPKQRDLLTRIKAKDEAR